MSEKIAFSSPDSPTVGGGAAATNDHQVLFSPESNALITRKLDRFIIPILGLLYLIAFLDRSNIGNANIAGLSDSLGLVGNQYGAAVSVLYATYCTFEPLSAVAFKKATPAIAFSGLCVIWGAITLGTAFVKSYGGLLASRICLGLAEAGLFPCINMYITMTYRPSEQGARFAWIYLCAALSGAFGGLLAYGLTQLDGVGGWDGWRWLYAIEGAITFCLAPLTWFWIPNDLRKAWFLNEEERKLCALRLDLNQHYNAHETFEWSEVKRGFSDPRTWLHALIQIAHNLTLYGFTTFMPAIIRGFGFTTVYAQLMTVPVYIWAAIAFFIVGNISDRVRQRGLFVLAANVAMAAGFFILIFTEPLGLRLFGLFVLATGVYPSTACNLIWNNSNSAGYYKRAVSSGVLQMVGNSAGAIVGQIYTSQDAPRYTKGMAISLGGNGVAVLAALVMMALLKTLNKRRRRELNETVDDLITDLRDSDIRFRLTY